MAEKIFHFSSDKNFRVRMLLLKHLPECQYYLNKEEKQTYQSLLQRMAQGAEDEIKHTIMDQPEYYQENETTRIEM